MAFFSVGKTSEFEDLRPRFVNLPGKNYSIAVYRFHGEYFAYLNMCPHQGGPACEGVLIGNVEVDILDDGARVSKRVSDERHNITCPWHGVEFDLATGICVANHSDRLRSYEVVVEQDQVKVRV